MKFDLGYGVIGFGRRYKIGVTGVGKGVGVTTVVSVARRELHHMGAEERVSVFDEPVNLDEMDIVIGVIDPLPSIIKGEIDKYRRLKERYDEDKSKTVFLLNKMNQGVDRQELERFLKLEFVYVQELIPAEKFYMAEYLSKDIFGKKSDIDFKGIKEMLQNLINFANL